MFVTVSTSTLGGDLACGGEDIYLLVYHEGYFPTMVGYQFIKLLFVLEGEAVT